MANVIRKYGVNGPSAGGWKEYDSAGNEVAAGLDKNYKGAVTATPAITSTSTPSSNLYTAGSNANASSLDTIKAALDSQNTAQASLYNQQAADQAAKIKQALAAQQVVADSNISSLNSQYGTAINTLNTEKAKLPAQTQVMNNSASSLGQQTAQKIRTAMAQMGLLQSGESASQALKNETTTSNSVNTNNVNQQNLDAEYGSKISAAQQELANKSSQIRAAMAQAQAAGDEQSLSILSEAAAKINADAAANATAYQNWAYKVGQDNFTNGLAQQSFNANQVQQAIDNAYRDTQASTQDRQFGQSLGLQEAGLTGVLNGQKTLAAQNADQAAEQFKLQYGLSVGEALGNINGNPTLAKVAQDIQNAQFKASLDQNQSQFSASLAADQANQAANRAASAANASSSASKPKALTVGQQENAATAGAIRAIQRDAPNMTRSEFNTAMADMKSVWIEDGADAKVIQEAIDNAKTKDDIAADEAAKEEAAIQANKDAWDSLPLWERLKRGTIFN